MAVVRRRKEERVSTPDPRESTEHDRLVQRAERWLLKTKGCAFALTDRMGTINQEQPDAIGWMNLDMRSLLVEVKVSRSDFLADKGKKFRRYPTLGMGDWRYYLCPPGVMAPDELRDGGRARVPGGRRAPRSVGVHT